MADRREDEAPAEAASRTPAEEAPPARNGPAGEEGLPDDELIVLAARGMLLFPHVVLPIIVGRQRSVAAVQAAVRADRPLGVVLQRNADDEDPAPEELYSVGTVASIVRYITAPDGTHHVIAQGQERFRILEYVQTEPYFVARVERMPEPEYDENETEIAARFLNLKAQAHQAVSLLPQRPEDLDQAIENAPTPSSLTDLIATFIEIPPAEKQEVLETFDLAERMDKVSERMARLVEVLTLSQEIRKKTQGKLEKAQREYYLREQLRQIQSELGEGQSVEIQDLVRAIEGARMPPAVKKEARRDLSRLERMPESAAEYGMLRAYLETLIELPWTKSTRDKLDIRRAREILDEDHHGLEKVKKRIVEFLAVRKLKPTGKGPILCFVGPPGVGKTSLGRSIARAMGRKFVRVSLGGVHDEAEIRGHRRTYVGAMPGNIVQNIRKAGANNPVFMLDEMDKLGRSLHGDPSSALLEVLDPEQNYTFTDHYLNVPFDLSKVMFIGTANVLDAIPGPLRDRCEVIELPGYTREEKLEIARRYLVGRRREANGLEPAQIDVTDAALVAIIRDYTREAGVRNLERELGTVMRHVATKVAAGEAQHLAIDAGDLAAILGPLRFESELALRTSQPGVATGLAWTPAGGDILFIESSAMPGKGGLVLTGQLGEVMKESAQAAVTLVKSNLDGLGVKPSFFEKHDVHVHVPAGAIPKDGPSAGVAMYTSLVSLVTGRTVESTVAMTGEISLRGLVLPVGGIKEKVLAARHAGIEKVLLPARNRKDFDEIPADVRNDLEFVWIENVGQALFAALRGRETPAEAPLDGDGASARMSASAGMI
ncbi:MAG: endopeptidase La [Planctomycetota bacterium]